MAIELWGAAPGAGLEAPVIRGNTFRDWTPSAKGHDAFGISVSVGHNTRIVDNTLVNGVDGYGIEAGPSGSVVEGNTVRGFPIGIVAQGQPDVTIKNNRLIEQTDAAIFLSNAGPNRKIRIVNNYIENPRNFGIGSSPNDYGGAEITGNSIYRSGGFYSDDGTRTDPFIGIKLDAGVLSPIRILNNTIVQSSMDAPAKFGFWAIGVFAGYPGSEVSGNTIESKSDRTGAQAFGVWSAGLMAGIKLQNNKFVNITTGL
jgi:hypothetical protein